MPGVRVVHALVALSNITFQIGEAMLCEPCVCVQNGAESRLHRSSACFSIHAS